MEKAVKASSFDILYKIDCKGHTEQKNGLTYLSWAWAWAELKKHFPTAKMTVYDNADGWNYFTDGRTCWVKVGIEVEGLEHTESFPVMDYRNASIPLDKVTSTDINKSIQRAATKAIARHGLGLYIYQGEETTDGLLEDALAEVQMASSREDLTAIWQKYKGLQKTPSFRESVTNKSKAYA